MLAISFDFESFFLHFSISPLLAAYHTVKNENEISVAYPRNYQRVPLTLTNIFLLIFLCFVYKHFISRLFFGQCNVSIYFSTCFFQKKERKRTSISLTVMIQYIYCINTSFINSQAYTQ